MHVKCNNINNSNYFLRLTTPVPPQQSSVTVTDNFFRSFYGEIRADEV